VRHHFHFALNAARITQRRCGCVLEIGPRDAVARIKSWRRIPAPLAWMAEARYRVDDLDGA
jgi:hypothetical protein